jgi:hypothetical protein
VVLCWCVVLFVAVVVAAVRRYALRLYAAINLPGCIGSTDGIQIPWANVPHAIREMYKGKGGLYSLGYNMTVSRDLWCQSIGHVYAGCDNDTTKAGFDPWIQQVRLDKKYTDRTFSMTAADGTTVQVTGVYLIGDRGYPRWEVLQQPAPTSSLDPKMMQMSEWIEASRKDVERFFGVLKSRWRVLKTPILLRDVSEIDNMVKSCVVLHNWYIDWRRRHLVAAPALPSDQPSGNFEPYNSEERVSLQRAQRRPGLVASGTQLVDGAGSQVISRVDERIRQATQERQLHLAGDYDASRDVTQHNNVRPPANSEEEAAVVPPADSELDRHHGKQKQLAEHIAFHMSAGTLSWNRYELVPLLSVAELALWAAQIRAAMLRVSGHVTSGSR